VSESNNVLAQLGQHFHGVWAFTLHAPMTLPFWLAISGIAFTWLCYQKYTHIPAWFCERFALIYNIMLKKYGFDTFNDWFFAKGARKLGLALWQWGDQKTIDGYFVNGSAHMVGRLSGVMRKLQSGLLNQYAFIMIIGLLVMVSWWFWILA